jgi:hypothetical protein
MKLSSQEHLLPGESILEKWEFAAFDGIRDDAKTGLPQVLRRLRSLMGSRHTRRSILSKTREGETR